MRDFYS